MMLLDGMSTTLPPGDSTSNPSISPNWFRLTPIIRPKERPYTSLILLPSRALASSSGESICSFLTPPWNQISIELDLRHGPFGVSREISLSFSAQPSCQPPSISGPTRRSRQHWLLQCPLPHPPPT